MPRRVVLVNTNTMRPPVAPLALDYIGDGLRTAGFPVRLVDLCFVKQPRDALVQALRDEDPLAIGVTFRNTDDCFWRSGAWFIPELSALIKTIRGTSSAPIVLGGCGFSIFPAPILDKCAADLAVVGDGEDAFLQLAQCLDRGTAYDHVPGLIRRGPDGAVRINPPKHDRRLDLVTDRRTIDNINLSGSVENNEDLLRPLFYVDQRLGGDPEGLVTALIAGDERFFAPAGADDTDGYNYNDHAALTEAIAAGARGAFWDILRRIDTRPDAE